MTKRIMIICLFAFVMFSGFNQVHLAAAKPSPKPAAAASWCWCTQYVYAKKGLTGAYGNAETWVNGFLRNNGYSITSTPAVGNIVVYNSLRMGNNGAGHVGIIHSVTSTSLVVKGANQAPGDPEFIDANCTNVRLTTFSRQSSGETYWRK